jgi:hypothetical protein
VPDGEWQRIGNQIDAAMIFARADFVFVHSSTDSFFSLKTGFLPLPLSQTLQERTPFQSGNLSM